MATFAFRSVFDTAERVEIDPWAANPLVDDLAQCSPATYALAAAEGPAPTMFESGPLPPFTASGADVEVLNRLPFRVRHAAAAEPDKGRLLAMVEQFSTDPDGSIPTGAYQDYESRVRRWASGTDAAPREQVPTSQLHNLAAYVPSDQEQARANADAGLYDTLFGEYDQTRQAKAKAAALADEAYRRNYPRP